MALLLSLLFLTGKSVAAPDIALPINSQVPPVARISEPFNFTFSASTFTSATGILNYVAKDTPAWLHFDASSRTLSGIPGTNAAGSSNFNLIATDITGSTTMPATLVVSNGAGPSLGTPVEEQLSAHDDFQPPDTILLPRSSSLAISFSSDTFVNTNRDTVYYAMCANNTPLPSWITFDTGSLSFSGTAPQNTSPDELPQTFNIQFTASDVVGFSAAVATFRVTVQNHVLMFENEYYPVNITPNQVFEYNGLQGALILNEVPVDQALIRHVEVETPSWMVFDQDKWALSGIPPLSAESQNISVTAEDKYGETAVTTILLQVDTNPTEDLFSGIPDSINAIIGMDFNYTFNASAVTTSNAALAVDLGHAPSWLRFDKDNQQLSGRVPKDLAPQTILLNVTVSQGSKVKSGPLRISVQDPTHSADGRAMTTPGPSAGDNPAESTTASGPSSSPESKSHTHGNNSRMAAAIAVPVIAICLLLILACIFLTKRKKRERRRTDADWSSEQKRTVSRPFLPEDAGNAGSFVEKPATVVERPSRAPFIDLPGFRSSMASKRHSFFRLSKGTTDEAVQTPDVDSWEVYTRDLNTAKPKDVELRRFSLLPEEEAAAAAAAQRKRGSSSNRQAFRSSKPLRLSTVSSMKRTEPNRRRSDMSFTSGGLLTNRRMSGFGHGRNRSSLGTSSSFGWFPRGIGHGNGGPPAWGHVRRSWRDRSRSSWATTNTSDLSSGKYNSSDRSQNIGSTMQSFPRPPTVGALECVSLSASNHRTADSRRESIRVVGQDPPPKYGLALHDFNKDRARERHSRPLFAAGPSSRVSSHLKWTHPIRSSMHSPTQSMDSATSIIAKRRSGRFNRSTSRRTPSRTPSIHSPTRHNPTKPRPSPRKLGSGISHNDGEGGLASLISNAITQRIHSDSQSSITSSSSRRLFGSGRASAELSNHSPEVGLEEVKDEEGNRRWKYPDVRPNPLGLHTPVDTPPDPRSPKMTEDQPRDGEDYVTAGQILLEPTARTAEGLSGRLQRLSHLRQQGFGGRYGGVESGQRRFLVGGSRGKRPVSVDNGLVARGASMRGDLVGGDDDERDVAFI